MGTIVWAVAYAANVWLYLTAYRLLRMKLKSKTAVLVLIGVVHGIGIAATKIVSDIPPSTAAVPEVLGNPGHAHSVRR